MDGSVNFYRKYKEYVQGFGTLSKEHWLGLSHLHLLTSGTPQTLLIDMKAKSSPYTFSFAKYDDFSVGSESTGFKLTVGSYAGNDTKGDMMTYHNGMKFTTFDKDQDAHSSMNCGELRQGGYWYRHCATNNLNGVYTATSGYTVITWSSSGSSAYVKGDVTMSFRRTYFR